MKTLVYLERRNRYTFLKTLIHIFNKIRKYVLVDVCLQLIKKKKNYVLYVENSIVTGVPSIPFLCIIV